MMIPIPYRIYPPVIHQATCANLMYASRYELTANMRGNARQEAARVVGMYQAVRDVCHRNGLGENEARMILERLHHDELHSRQFTEQLKHEFAKRGVNL